MKTKKEEIYDFIRQYFSGDPSKGVSTKAIADALNLQRTNVSSILNALVMEHKIEKTNGRPVLYYVKSDASSGMADSCFTSLVGYNGSLKRAVQLAKAAVLYPSKSLDTVLMGARGTGKSLLAKLMFQFAVDNAVLPANAMFAVFDCQKYAENDQKAIKELFGNQEEQGYFAAARHGILFFDNAQCLSTGLRAMVLSRLEGGAQTEPTERTASGPMVIVSCEESNRAACEDFSSKFPIVIELPKLCERPLGERMEMIRKFLTLEAACLNKTLVMNAELLRCLLLYDCDANCLQLKADIKIGCANAYVREHNSGKDAYQLYISDFEQHVRKGFFQYKTYGKKVEEMIPSDYSYAFNQSSMKTSAVEKQKLENKNIYDELERKAMALAAKGLENDEINLILSAEIENDFRGSEVENLPKIANKKQLSLLVDQRMIDCVERFLQEASEKLARRFSDSVFYGLCLHLNAVVNRKEAIKVLSPKQIAKVVENFRPEYMLSLHFAESMQKKFQVMLPVDETVFIAMFLSQQVTMEDTDNQPVVLLAFYGKGVAQSICDSITNLTHLKNVYAFELFFEDQPESLYQILKQKIQKIERGKGIMAVYDGSVVGKMLSSIEEELQIVIRQIPLPVTTLGIELARKAAVCRDLNQAYQETVRSLHSSLLYLKKVIVTLCTTGEGGAKELKTYLERFGKLNGAEVIPLAAADHDRLREEFAELMNTAVIQCVVGTYDPQLFALPFVSVADVFRTPKEKLPSLLHQTGQKHQAIDYTEVYRYLNKQLEHTNVNKLKKLLPDFVEKVNENVCELPLESEVGLFLHIACCIERIHNQEPTPSNIHREWIMTRYGEQFKTLLKLVKPLEKAFDVIFSDDEIANLLTIIYKL